MKRFLVLFAPFLLAGLALAGVQLYLGKREQAEPAQPPRPVPVVVAKVQMIDFDDAVEAVGRLKASESITISADLTEIVKAVHFRDGEDVEAGKLLLELDDKRPLAELAEARADLVDRKRRFERINILARQEMTALQDRDTRQAEMQAAQARVEAAEARVKDLQIRAPFSGRLGLRRVSPGALVEPGTPIATLDDLRTMYLDFPAPEAFLAALKPGLAVSAKSIALPGRSFNGTVKVIDTRLDASVQAALVRVALANPDKLLLPNMLMTVELKAGVRKALALPEHALIPLGESQTVFAVGKNEAGEAVALRKIVRIGGRKPGIVEILDGASEGETMIVEGVNRVRPGGRVEITAEKALTDLGSKPAPTP